MATTQTTDTTANAKTDGGEQKKSVYDFAEKDGVYRRQVSSFRDFVSPDPNAEFPAEKDRYVLYINPGCPWAARTNLVRSLKGLEDVIQLVKMDSVMTEEGWPFTGRAGTDEADPLYGFKLIKQLYLKAEPNYTARYTVPVLWDKKRETIVNNESGDIIRILYSAFDAFVAPERREATKAAAGGGNYLPEALKADIDEMNAWVYPKINNGVYLCGFATSQEAYEQALYPLFEALNRVEEILAKNGKEGKGPYLFGKHITEADIRLYPTIVRFDAAYYAIFKTNLKMIRYDYPYIHTWLRKLYWDESDVTRGAFKSTTHFDHIKLGYTAAVKLKVIPAGPQVNVLPLDA